MAVPKSAHIPQRFQHFEQAYDRGFLALTTGNKNNPLNFPVARTGEYIPAGNGEYVPAEHYYGEGRRAGQSGSIAPVPYPKYDQRDDLKPTPNWPPRPRF